MIIRPLIIVLAFLLPYIFCYCEEGVSCSECDLIGEGDACNTLYRLPFYFCDNVTSLVGYLPSKYLLCVNNKMVELDCSHSLSPGIFNSITRECQAEESREYTESTESMEETRTKRTRRSATGSSRVGDSCSFNTDCQRGMFCGGGVCTCLSDFVSISHHCWAKVNPGESGCVERRQCESVWPGTSCSPSGVCECPEGTVPSRTRDGTICISSSMPPSCPLPEPHNGNPNPATVLANPTTHPLNPGEYTPVLCTSTSSETINSNGGDGSTWCIYPNGDEDVYIADIYNCISHPQINNDVFPDYSETVDGVCCHNRAFTCAAPMESGEEPSVPRWWFNSATGSCVQFMWDPDTIQGASPNNFRTAEHCESYCRDTCRRGSAEFVASRYSILDEVPKTNCLSSTAKCSPDHQCQLIGSHQTCCPNTAHICSSYGGRLYPSKPIENYDRGVLIAGSRSTTRYYYDVEQGRCVNFLYHGLGNYNNFVTKQDCEAFCSKLVCENGNPLRIGEEWQRCETNTDCPSSHTCQSSHKVCCPTAQSLCTQPKRLGDCTSSVRRYWYNAATKQCEMFHYTGCQGNDNNFDSLVQCQQRCKSISMEPKCSHGRAYRDRNGNFQQCSDKQNGAKCPVNYQCSFDGVTHGCCPNKAFTCSLNPDKGVQCGSGRTYRYYFNSNKQACETFQYEGCDGNSNNFLTGDECQQYCGIGGCPNGGVPLRDEGSNRQKECSDIRTCPSTHECISIPSNGNVANRCCPTKAHICSQPPQQGNHCSKISVTRYYFNIVTRDCAPFQYNGCNGNQNNFASSSECNNFCSSAGCSVGEIAFKDVNSKKAYDCNNILKNSCPANFQCRYNSLTTGYVCCGSAGMDVCPPNERAFINAMDESVRECAINVAGSCPSEFLCRFNAQKNRYYCCAPTTDNICPDGRALFRAPKTLLPQRCNINGMNACTDGYTCQSRNKNVLQGFCCSGKNVCKNDAEFLIDDKTKMPRICTPGSFISCPSGYRCHKSSPTSPNGFCCKGEITAVTEGCPPGEYAYTKKSEVVHCDPFNPNHKGCPNSFSCQFSVAFQRYQCCGKDPIEEEEEEQQELGCPLSQVALVENESPVVCTSSSNTCPTGYFCQFSDKNKQFQCCGHKSGCPGLSVSYIDMTGQARECNLKAPNCPEGYSCQRTQNGKHICCTGKGNSVRRKDPKDPAVTSTTTTTTEIPQLSTTETLESSTEENTVASVETTSKAKGACSPNQIMTNGECKVRGSFGAACLLSSQCNIGAECINMVCACGKTTQEKDGKCEKIGCAPEQIEVSGKCLSPVSMGGACEHDMQCRNGAECRNAKCQCTEGTAPYKDRCLANLCGTMRSPVLDEYGLLVSCMGNSKCKKPSYCTFSKMISTYICCATKGMNKIVRKLPVINRVITTKRPLPTRVTVPTTRSSLAKKKNQCPNGEEALLFPGSKMALACSRGRACPSGYICLNRLCCPNSSRRKRSIANDSSPLTLCPRGYRTLIQPNHNGVACVKLNTISEQSVNY